MGNQSVKAPESEAEELSYLTNLQISQIDKLYERYKLQLTYQGFANSLFFFLDFWNLVAIKVTWLEMIYETVAWNQIHSVID